MLILSLFALGASLTVQADAPAQTSTEDGLITAERIYREVEGGPIIAEGDVRAASNGQFLRADRIIYDQENDRVIAVGNVAGRDESGQLYFAEEATLTGDLRNGVIEGFEAQLPPNGTLAAATAVRRASGKNQLNRVVYTLCEVCNDGFWAGRPTWQLKARNVTQDETAKKLRFTNAFLEVYGVPTLYIPYIEVPDPSVKRAAGFLAPQIQSSTRTGIEIETPYYLPISDYQDILFSPRHHSRLGTLIKGEWRRNTWNSQAQVQAGIINPTNDLTEEPGNPDDVRWHWFSRYTRALPGGWELEADIDGVSDKGYLLTYDIEPTGDLQEELPILRPDRLTSNLSFRRTTENSSTDVTGYVFQTLRFNENQDFTAQALPRLRHKHYFNLPVGEASIDASFLALERTEGLDSMRMSANAQYSVVKLTDSGHRFEAFAELRGDLYRYENTSGGTQACNPERGGFASCSQELPRGLEDEEFIFGRFLPTIGAEWSYPLAKVGQRTSFIVAPRVQAVISPTRDFSDDVFNDDSQSFQFDQVTLFDYNKSSGLDLWEDGQRVNVGLATTASFGQSLTIETMLGAQFRAEETEAFGPDRGLGERTSDVVGAVDFRVGRNIVLDNRFRIDKNTGQFRRVENSLRGNLGPLSGSLDYLRIQSDEALGTVQRLDEFLTIGANLVLTRNISFAATQAQNLDSGSTTNTQVALRIANRCGAVSFRYRFDDSTIGGFEQNRVLLVKFDLLGFN
ncbi:MAG: LPS assembly protein LptD [Pseudomonadota bacterium]